MTQDFGFDGPGDAEKVKFCEAEVAATLGKLDEMIAQLASLRTEVEDPDGFGSPSAMTGGCGPCPSTMRCAHR